MLFNPCLLIPVHSLKSTNIKLDLEIAILRPIDACISSDMACLISLVILDVTKFTLEVSKFTVSEITTSLSFLGYVT